MFSVIIWLKYFFLACIRRSGKMASKEVSCFDKLRGRLSGTRLVLETFQKGTELHAVNSELQFKAIMSLIRQSDLKSLSADSLAVLSGLASRIPFLEEHALAITVSFANVGHSKGRRGQQDFNAFPFYMSEAEWSSCSNLDAALSTIVNVVVRRLNCVNATEDTKKRMRACIMVCAYGKGALALDPKMKLSIKKRFNTLYDKQRKQEKSKSSHSKKPYLANLPANPLECQRLHPDLNVSVDGGFVTPPIDMELLEICDGSMACRGDSSMQVALIGSQSQPSADFSQGNVIQQLLQAVVQMRGGSRNDDDFEINYNSAPPRKRNLKALLDDAQSGDVLRHRRRPERDQHFNGVDSPAQPSSSINALEDKPALEKVNDPDIEIVEPPAKVVKIKKELPSSTDICMIASPPQTLASSPDSVLDRRVVVLYTFEGFRPIAL